MKGQKNQSRNLKKNLKYKKARNMRTPWLVFSIIVATVFVIAFSAFKTRENPLLIGTTQQKSLRESLNEVNKESEEENKTPASETQKNQENPPQSNYIGKVQAKMDLNLHSTPLLDNNINGIVNSGETVSVKGIEGKWYHVVTSDNKEGYVTSNTKYITVIEMNP